MEEVNSNKARFIYAILQKTIFRLKEHELEKMRKIQRTISAAETDLPDNEIDKMAEEVVGLFLPAGFFPDTN